MDAKGFIREMFKTDSSIRYVAIVNNEFRIIASEQREGTASFTTDETQRNYISIMPPIIADAVEKLEPFLGSVRGVTVHYEKVLLVFYRFGNLVIALSFEPEVATPFFTRISEAFVRLSKEYLS
jgi:hypothetical protein